MTEPRLWHGGAPGLRPEDLIDPRGVDDTAHLVDGCPTCEAMRSHDRGEDLARPDRVYVTADREYARVFAAGYPRGALYRVEAVGALEETTGVHDVAPSWAVPAARVLAVYDACVVLSPGELRRVRRRFVPAG